MPFDSETHTWTDLGGGWARDERGHTVRTVTEIEDVVAEHCFGGTYCDQPFTRLTKRKLWADGGAFIANRDGHLSENAIVRLAGHERVYRLRCVVVARIDAARAAEQSEAA